MRHIALVSALIVMTGGFGAAQDYPRAEVFLGYTYLRANSATDVPAFSANGGSGQLVINLGRWIGAVADVGAVHNGNIGGYHLDTTLTNFLFGPRIPIRVSNRVIPYFQTLFGGVYASSSAHLVVPPGTVVLPPVVTPVNATATSTNPVALRASAQQTAFAMAVGGGLDIKLARWVNFRPIGVDYFMTRLQNFRTMNDNNQHNLRYTAGFNFTIGGEAPAPPPAPPRAMKTCWNGASIPVDEACPKRDMTLRLATAQAPVCPGASVTLTPSGDVPEGAGYAWSVNGQKISEGRSFEFGTTGRDPGTYTIGLAAMAPDYNDTAATTTVTVLPYGPPTGSVQAAPTEIWAGDQATITARFTPGQCGGALGAPQLSVSEGSISGSQYDSSAVRFDPSDNSEQRKTVTVTARVTDQRGVNAAETTLIVKKRAVILARRLPDVIFPANSARVNNCGKRVLLEELKALTDRDPGGKVVFVGHITEREKAELDRSRAMNSAAVISAGQGICGSFPAAQVFVGTAGAADNGVDLQPRFCGTSTTPRTSELSGQTVRESDAQAKFRRVEVWFVPTGGVMPASATNFQAASALPVGGLGCPK